MLRRFALLCTALLVMSCANEEQEQLITQLQTDMNSANAVIDSLTYTLDDADLLLDAMRAQVDSAQHVNEILIKDAQRLNKSLSKFRKVAQQRKEQNERLQSEIRRMKVEKQADSQAIAHMRGQADSLNGVLLEAHTSIRRQSDHIRNIEMDLAKSQDQVSTLQAAQQSVRLYVAGEKFLEENGYLDASRPFGRAFRKQYKLVKKLNPEDPGVQLVPINNELVVEGKVEVLVDRFGTLNKGEDYKAKTANGQTTVTFINELITGSDVLAIVKN
ncbi:MAG: DNA repair exonuclease SbcCD ATPase subunit [Candidatus Latescibacterota bacterium]|jgi:DNA repair exonuclease SbcCD ATPase subunit